MPKHGRITDVGGGLEERGVLLHAWIMPSIFFLRTKEGFPRTLKG
jgi:hypothetical protein